MLSPDIYGNRIAFTREGDIWLGNLTTGEAKRLTRHEGLETRARFSPDGTQIAFQGQYDGGPQVYVMPTDGGVPRRVTNHITAALLEDWTPDGKKLLCRGPGAKGVLKPFFAPVSGGSEEPIPLQQMGMGEIGPNGLLAFCRFNDIPGGAWFRYHGGSRNDIWIGDLKTNIFKKVFVSQTQAQYPQWIDGRVFFVHENQATWVICSVAPDGSGLKQYGSPSHDLIYDLQTDGKRLIYVKGTALDILDPALDKTFPVNTDLNSDAIHMRPMKVDAASNISGYTISPTGKRLLVEARGQILSVPVKEGEIRVWKSIPGSRLQHPVMSPNGKKVAYISDETREQQVYVADADGSNPLQVTKDSGRQLVALSWSPTSDWLVVGDSEAQSRLVRPDGSEDRLITKARRSDRPLACDFSPDGKWFAYVEEKPWTNQFVNVIYLYDIVGKKSFPVTSGRFLDDTPSFSTDGKFLAYVSYRNLAYKQDAVFSQLNTSVNAYIELIPLSKSTVSPFIVKDDEEPPSPAESSTPTPAEKPSKQAEVKVVKVDLDGIQSRLITVSGVTGPISQAAVVGDRILFTSGNQINTYDLKTRSQGTLTTGSSFATSPDGKSVLIPGPRVVAVSAESLPATAGAVSLQGYKLDVDPPKEWEQIFWDAWRLCRDYFYVRNMHGNDWLAIGKKYAALLPQVRSRSELTELIRWMQAELSIGHSFRAEPNSFPAPPGSIPAYLGVETKPDQGWHLITRIYDGDGFVPRSPLLETGLGVDVGTYILAVNGRPSPADMDWRELLRDRAGEVVSLTVNSKPTTTGARTIYVKPHTAAVERALIDRDAVRDRREYVDRKSGGKVGYIYLASMGDNDMSDFALQYGSQLDKDALIVDIRHNNGGYISAVLVSILKKQTYLRRSQRNAIEPGTRFTDAFEGALCMLIDEGSYSDGEGGPANWHYAKLGPLIGTHTFGALVGSEPLWPLMDGGGIQVPRYGNYRADVGWVVESNGMAPDIDVENDPNLWAKGIDAQLDRAIQEMLDRSAKNPIKRPVQPPDPVKNGLGS